MFLFCLVFAMSVCASAGLENSTRPLAMASADE